MIVSENLLDLGLSYSVGKVEGETVSIGDADYGLQILEH